MENIVVSIICNTYNHEKYIGDALESFVTQKTDFAFEVLIHDDASTDNTADIIRQYEAKYPELIRPIYQVENQYSQNVPIGVTYQFPRVKGKYIALCEGDDYWTDPYKLQKQVDALEAHPELDICAHPAYQILADTGEIIADFGPAVMEDTVFTTEQVIQGGGGFVATNALMYRSELAKNMPPFRQMFHADYAVQVHGALRGGMLYLKDNMAHYRWQAEGSWSVRMAEDSARYMAWDQKVLKMLHQLDADTDYRYHEVIAQKCLKNEFSLLQRQGNYAALRKEPYREIYRKLSLRKKLGMAAREFVPWLYNILKR